MGDMMEADLFGNPGHRPGGLQQKTLRLLDPVVLEISHRRHAVSFQHAFGQIVGVVIQFLLQQRIVDVLGIIAADIELDAFGKLDGGSVRGEARSRSRCWRKD